VKHIPGSGMTQATKNRLIIYNTIGGISQLYRISRTENTPNPVSLGAAQTLALMANSQSSKDVSDQILTRNDSMMNYQPTFVSIFTPDCRVDFEESVVVHTESIGSDIISDSFPSI